MVLEYLLIALGGLCLVAGNLADKYHDRLQDAHRDRLRGIDTEDPDLVREEILAFYEDERVEWAMRLMLLEPFGFLFVIIGIVLTTV